MANHIEKSDPNSTYLMFKIQYLFTNKILFNFNSDVLVFCLSVRMHFFKQHNSKHINLQWQTL